MEPYGIIFVAKNNNWINAQWEKQKLGHVMTHTVCNSNIFLNIPINKWMSKFEKDKYKIKFEIIDVERVKNNLVRAI